MLCHEVYVCSEMADPTKNFDMVASIRMALVKAAMIDAFASSSEHSVKVYRKPALMAKAVCKMKSGSMTLVFLSRNISPVSARKAIMSGAVVVKDLYTDKDGYQMHGVVRSDLRFPKEDDRQGCARHEQNANIIAAWACREGNPSESNAVRSIKEVKIKIGVAEVFVIKVPTIVNTQQIQAGEEIVVLKPALAVASSDSSEDENPPAKKAKCDKGVDKGSGKQNSSSRKGRGKGSKR